MNRTISKVLFLLLLLLPARSYSKEHESDIPKSIKVILNSDYPGWAVYKPTGSDMVELWKTQKIEGDPNIVSGDFDDNGAKDFAIRIKSSKDQQEYILCFLSVNKNFQKLVVNETTNSYPESLLGVSTKGTKGHKWDQDGPKDYIFKQDTIEDCAFEKGCTAYVLSNRKFETFTSSD
jgi:hypothetical protein